MKDWDSDTLDLDLRRAVAEAWRQAALHGSMLWRRDEPVEHRFALKIEGVGLEARVKFTASIEWGEPDPAQASTRPAGGQNVDVVCDLALIDPVTGEQWAADQGAAFFLDEGRDEKLPLGSELAEKAMAYAVAKLAGDPRFLAACEAYQLERAARTAPARSGPGRI